MQVNVVSIGLDFDDKNNKKKKMQTKSSTAGLVEVSFQSPIVVSERVCCLAISILLFFCQLAASAQASNSGLEQDPAYSESWKQGTTDVVPLRRNGLKTAVTRSGARQRVPLSQLGVNRIIQTVAATSEGSPTLMVQAGDAPSDAENSQRELPSRPVGQAPPREKMQPRQIVDLLRRRDILTPRGTLIVEPSLQFSNSSVTRVALEGFTIIPAITIGAVDVRDVDRDTLTAALTFRYGFTGRFEMTARVPYVYRDDTVRSRPLNQPVEDDLITDADGSGLGDLELGFHFQLNRPPPKRPYFVANLRYKARTGTHPFEVETDPDTGLQKTLPTGSGFWGIQPSLTMSYPSDPAVFFASLSYLWNVEREIDDERGEIDPGDAVGISFGMGFAINEDASFVIGYGHNFLGKTEQNGENVEGSENLQIGTLSLGASHRTGKRTSLSVAVGVGVTEDAPDAQITVKVPIATSLR